MFQHENITNLSKMILLPNIS